jgi:Leucine-rich repeat (LRR) protein
LSLAGNKISEIKGLKQLINLRKLYLSDNEIGETEDLKPVIKNDKFKKLLIYNNLFLSDFLYLMPI